MVRLCVCNANKRLLKQLWLNSPVQKWDVKTKPHQKKTCPKHIWNQRTHPQWPSYKTPKFGLPHFFLSLGAPGLPNMVGLSSSTTLNQHKSLVHPLIHDGHSIENHQGSVAPPKPIQASEPPARTTAKLVVLLRGKTPPSKKAWDKKAKR